MKAEIVDFEEKLRKSIEGYEFEIGILANEPHYKAANDKSSYAGSDRRLVTRTAEKGMQELGGELETRFSWLSRPFMEWSRDMYVFAEEYLKSLSAKDFNVRRVENYAQAIVRNPILRGDYGSNTEFTAQKKGFNHLLWDTAQFFKAIKARLIKKGF